MKKNANTLLDEFTIRGWDSNFLDAVSVLGKKKVRRSAAYYELVDPTYAFSCRNEGDVKLLYDNDFIPIGTCSNGDFIVVFVAKTSGDFVPGSVYLLSHGYGWEEAIDNPSILPQITRLLASNTDAFLKLASDKQSGLPFDYFDGNDKPYRPPYMQKKKKKARKK